MAANPDLMAAVVKVRQKLHRRFWSNTQQVDHQEFKALQRKVSPQRVFDLSSEKFRVSRSPSLDKKKQINNLDQPSFIPIPSLSQHTKFEPLGKPSSQESHLKDDEIISCKEKLEVYEAIILKMSRKIQYLKRENSTLKTKEQRLQHLEQKLDLQTVTEV